MNTIYRPQKGLAILELLAYLITVNVVLFIFNKFVNSYVEMKVILMLVIAFSLYCIYYILLDLSLKYIIKEDGIEINGVWGIKKEIIPYSSIDGYLIQKGNIQGFRLSGFGRHKYCFGRCVIERVGISHMFVTSSKEVIYVHTDEMSYGLSPIDVATMESMLVSKGFGVKEFQVKKNKNVDLFKEKSFFIPFILVSVILIVMTLNPIILYWMQKLPKSIPLAFDSTFKPILYGTGKQFAFKQMSYGALNMVVLLCMYYAAYFCAKYDRRSAYKYIYISLISASTFLAVQLQILKSFI